VFIAVLHFRALLRVRLTRPPFSVPAEVREFRRGGWPDMSGKQYKSKAGAEAVQPE